MRAYLDHNATSPLRPQALEAMIRAMADVGNASSVHAEGRHARLSVRNARESVAGLVGASADMVIFTSGGTEANNLALRGAIDGGLGGRLLVSAIEHPSVLNPAALAGVPSGVIPVDGDGRLDLGALDTLLARDDRKALVSVMLANNETGAIQPMAEIADMVHSHGGLVHCDAIQAAGRIALKWSVLGVDMLSLSAHKLGGPQGVGALIVKPGLKLHPQTAGGAQENYRRAGTENVAGLAGFAAAITASLKGLEDMASIADERDRIETAIRKTSPAACIFSKHADRLVNTSCFAVSGLDAQMLLIALDLDGVAVSSGSACSSGKVARSHVLDAMGVEPGLSESAIRVSLGWSTTQGDTDRFIAAWRRILARNGTFVAAA